MGKRSKKGKGGPSINSLFKAEDVLQAVILADTFRVKFRPPTWETPKVLLPLANVPMLEYSLEFLEASGVQQIYVVCMAHSQKIEDYLQSSRWYRKSPKLQVKTIVTPEGSFSTGDALRFLDSLKVIQNDFVLISGDVVSNINLAPILKKHKDRVAEDKRNILTVVLKKVARSHRSRPLTEDTVFGINKKTRQLLVYDNDLEKGAVSMDVAHFEQNASIEFRFDLMDTHIDICTPEVLHLFTDNFDWTDMRSSFVTGVLESDIMGNKIHTCEINNKYAARVQDWKTYDSVSKDILARWTYPIVPDNNMLGDTHYQFSRGNVYKEVHYNSKRSVQLARSARVKEDTVIGGGTSVGEKTLITKSIIGRRCKIGTNCKITNCYLWDGCTIEDNVVLDHAVVCSNALVKRGAKVRKGSVLSYNTVIGRDVELKPYSLVTTFTNPAEAGFDSEPSGDEDDTLFQMDEDTVSVHSAKAPRSAELGEDGVGHICTASEVEADDMDDDQPVYQLLHSHHCHSLAPDTDVLTPELIEKHQVDEDTDDEFFDEDMLEVKEFDIVQETRVRFFREIRETVIRGQLENHTIDNIQLEVASLKLSHDATVTDYGSAVCLGLFELIDVNTGVVLKDSLSMPPPPPPQSQDLNPAVTSTEPGHPDRPRLAKLSKAHLKSLQILLKRWCDLLKKFGAKTEEQYLLLLGLEAACLHEEGRYVAYFPFALQYLYQFDVLLQEAIERWDEAKLAALKEAGDDVAPAFKTLMQSSRKFVNWLQEAESESETESGSDSDSD